METLYDYGILFDIVGFKYQHLFEFNLCHMILNKMFILLRPSFWDWHGFSSFFFWNQS